MPSCHRARGSSSNARVTESRWGTSCAFADYDRDGDLDLYVANYVQFDERTIPGRGTTANCRFMATDVFCGPKQLTGEKDALYRNNGDGTFADVSTTSGAIDPGYYGFGVVFADLDDDGWPDIFVANDSVPNLVFHNRNSPIKSRIKNRKSEIPGQRPALTPAPSFAT